MSRPGRKTTADRTPSSRDQRLFASIQSTLNGSGVSTTTPSSRKQKAKQKVNEPIEELNDLDAIITQISDLKIRSDRSALQIKRNISACGFLSQMSEDDWNEICKSLVGTALTDGETDFVVDLFIPLM
ncbi:hypothetical protein OSTOST_08398, partial [Ostertagia ostertagi]